MSNESADQDTTTAGTDESTETTTQNEGEQQQPGDTGATDTGGEGEQKEVELKAPDGLDESAFQTLTERAKELGFDGEQAQKFIDSHAEAQKGFTEQAQENWKQLTNDWLEQTKADEEIGGEQFEQSVQLADKALTQFATPEFKQALNESGYGNHPEMVRIFARIGKQLSEDTPVGGEDNRGGDVSREKKLYPNLA